MSNMIGVMVGRVMLNLPGLFIYLLDDTEKKRAAQRIRRLKNVETLTTDTACWQVTVRILAGTDNGCLNQVNLVRSKIVRILEDGAKRSKRERTAK